MQNVSHPLFFSFHVELIVGIGLNLDRYVLDNSQPG